MSEAKRPKIGEEFPCQRCGKIIVRRTAEHKHCRECAPIIKRERSKLRLKETEDSRHKRQGSEYVCRCCGKVSIRMRVNQMYCEECRNDGSIKRMQQEKNKERPTPTVTVKKEPKSSKPNFSLAEVEAAARKNGMNYGRYVAAWKNGTAPAPVHLPKKKRGRPKKCSDT